MSNSFSKLFRSIRDLLGPVREREGNVKLYIGSPKDHQCASSVSVFNEPENKFTPVKPFFNRDGHSKFDLGDLDSLTHCHLFVDTVVQTGGRADYDPEIAYAVSYSGQTVEEVFKKPEFDEYGFAFFRFRFKFCPRYPFC